MAKGSLKPLKTSAIRKKKLSERPPQDIWGEIEKTQKKQINKRRARKKVSTASRKKNRR